MNDSREIQDAEPARSGNSHVPIDECHSHLIQFLKECQAVLWECRAAKMGRQAFGLRIFFGKRLFANPEASSSARYPQEKNPWSPLMSEGRMRIKHHCRIRDASPDRQPKIQSSSVEETLQRIMGQTNNDCRFRISILTNSPTPATFACWKIRFKTEVWTCSQCLTETMHCIKGVEMVIQWMN